MHLLLQYFSLYFLDNKFFLWLVTLKALAKRSKLSVKHLKKVYQGMFERLATSQNIAWQAKIMQTCCMLFLKRHWLVFKTQCQFGFNLWFVHLDPHRWVFCLCQFLRSVSDVYTLRSVRCIKLLIMFRDVSAVFHNFEILLTLWLKAVKQGLRKSNISGIW